MRFFRSKKHDCGLLPHIKENIYGIDPSSVQMIPWQLKTFNVEQAWRYSQGEDVVVAIIDTGCDMDHDDLKDNIIKGYNMVSRNNNPEDRNGHGTHVAGTIAAVNNSLGLVGVSPKVKIMPIKALSDSGTGMLNDIADAIYYAIENKADIISMSLGSKNGTPIIEKALEKATSACIPIFCAAGNDGNGTDVMFPANNPNTISIGAIDKSLSICDFSCCGESLDFLAPGKDIVSTCYDNGYAKMSGTSMATPFATGCAALLLSLRNKQNKKLITKDDYINEFKENALKLKDPRYSGNKSYEGYGIIRPKV